MDTTTDQVLDYEAAARRFNKISGSIEEIRRAAQAVIDWAESEYDAAQADLARYEIKPGIPQAQYRRTIGA
jgi:hypothetical protein